MPPPSVPWDGLDVFFLFLLWNFLILLFTGLAWLCVEIRSETPPPASAITEEAPEHPLTRLLVHWDDWPPLLLLIPLFSAVVAAPLAEEFFYRLLLQRWLEKTAWDFCQTLGAGPRRAFSGVFSVTVSALLFAAVHGGKHSGEMSRDLILGGLLAMVAAHLAALLLAVGYLRFLRKATWRQLGLAPPDVKRDLLCPLFFVGIALPVMLAMKYSLLMLGPADWQVDPIPLFFLGILLGWLLFRSGRLGPSVMLHALFNGANFAFLLVQLRG